MSKTIVIKRFGNAKAIILPNSVLDELDLERGSSVDLSVQGGNIVLKPIRESVLSLESLMSSTPAKKVSSK